MLLSSSTAFPMAGIPSGCQLAAEVQLLSPAPPSHFHWPSVVSTASIQAPAQIIRFIFPLEPLASYASAEGGSYVKAPIFHRFFPGFM
jgi:hypothetical protein